MSVAPAETWAPGARRRFGQAGLDRAGEAIERGVSVVLVVGTIAIPLVFWPVSEDVFELPKLLTAVAATLALWDNALARTQPQVAVLYEDNFNYLSKMCLLRMREAAFKMIDLAKSRGCVVVLCGADATDHYEEYLEKGADYCILGEGEETLLELLDQLSGKKDAHLESILGLVSQSPASDLQSSTSPILHNARRPDITNLDALPFPAWDLVDVQKYRDIWLKRHGYFSMNMVTTRGCPYHCNWCAKPIWGQRYNLAPAAAAVADRDEAIAFAERAFRERDPFFVMLARTFPDYDRVRTDVRFREIVGRLGLPGWNEGS